MYIRQSSKKVPLTSSFSYILKRKVQSLKFKYPCPWYFLDFAPQMAETAGSGSGEMGLVG